MVFRQGNSFLDSILWTDEFSFTFDGYVNRQNIRFWALERPNIIEIKRFNRKLNIVVGFNTKFIIGPYFFEGGGGSPVTVNEERYKLMLESFVIPELKSRHKLKRTTFLQNGAPPHVCNFVKDLLTSNFNSLMI